MKLTKEQISYIIGFLHSDGHLYENTRNRGKISIELNEKDKDILIKIQKLIGGKISTRSRVTNFGPNTSVMLSIYSKNLRDYLKSQGMIAGKKSDIVQIPENLSQKDYLRGFVDGDGSIGITGNNEPFISIVTKSEKLKEQVLFFLELNFQIKKKLNRNKRDNIYNIVVKNESAQKFCNTMYDNSSISLDRKFNLYKDIMLWKRTKKYRAPRKNI